MLAGIQAALTQHDARGEQEGKQQLVLLKQRPGGAAEMARGGEEEGFKKKQCTKLLCIPVQAVQPV